MITGEKVAIKILEKDKIRDQSDVERVTREIHILKIVRHPNVIQLYEVSLTLRIINHFYRSLKHPDNFFSSWSMHVGVNCLTISSRENGSKKKRPADLHSRLYQVSNTSIR